MRFVIWLVAGVIALPFAGAAAEEQAPEGASPAKVVGTEVIDRGGATRVTLRAEGPDGPRLVDIYVGPTEGAAISHARAGVETPRPMTHDLLAAVVGKLGGKITRLTVSSLEGGIYIGELTISREGKEGKATEEIKIDTRPSDGMALAVAAGAAIYIVDEVIEQAGRPAPEDEGEDADKDEPRRPRPYGPPRDLI
jgi:hypothetical protein